MNQERIFQIIVSPHVTEKTAGDEKLLVLKVAKDATKPEIKKAAESLFGVKVANVRTVVQKGKVKRFRATVGKRSDFKKAYISLSEPMDYEQIMAG